MKFTKFNKYIILSFLLLGINGIYGQNFQASVSQNKVSTDDVFEVSFVYSGKDINSVTGFKAPTFTDFKVVTGPNQSTSMQYINGAVSGQKSFTYYIQPIRAGKFTIPSASITIGGQQITSNPITIEVTKGTGKPKKEGPSDVDMSEIAENLYIRAVADKSNVFNGEQVTVSYKLYTRLNISTPQITKLPNYQGFWAEEIDMPNVIKFSKETVDGVVYNVAVLKKAALFPQQTGELSVTQYELKIPVVIQRKRKSNDPWGDFFNDPFFRNTETVEYNARSNSLKIQVKALPPADADENFTGSVGSFKIEGSIDKKQIKQGEPVKIKYTLTGTGNISLLTLPQFDLGSGIEKYEDKTDNNINRSGLISGSKTVEYLLIPRNAGEVEIPEMRFTYFNPAAKKYETVETEGYSIEVTPSSDFVSNLPAQNQKGENDIRYIKTKFSAVKQDKSNPFADPLLWFFSLLPFVGLIGFALLLKKKENILADISAYKELQAKKFSEKKLKKAHQLMANGDKDGFYNEISHTLQQYLEAKLRISTAQFSIDAAEARLLKFNLPESLVQELKTTFEGIQFVRFAPPSGVEQAMQSVYSSASGLITGLEKAIVKRRKV